MLSISDLNAPSERIMAGLARLGIALKSQSWDRTGPLGLNPTQGQILTLLLQKSGMQVSLSELAEQLAVSLPTVSDSVKALENKGYVKKQTDTNDKRAVGISLTAKGRVEAERLSQWPDYLLDAVEELTESERRVFLRALVKMIRSLQVRGKIPVAQMCVTCRFFRPNVYKDPIHPHRCDFVNAPFGDGELRIVCLDHQSVPEESEDAIWQAFVKTSS